MNKTEGEFKAARECAERTFYHPESIELEDHTNVDLFPLHEIDVDYAQRSSRT